MNARFYRRSLILAALSAALFLSVAPAAQRPQAGEFEMRLGRITSIEDQGAGDIRITIALDRGTTAGVQAIGGGPIPVTLGMQVKLNFALGTAIFSPSIGSVIQVNEEKSTCVAQVDADLLERTVEDPSNQESHKVKEFLKTGSQVSMCADGKC